MAADMAYAPGGLGPLQKSWLRSRKTFLPAGNANPALPGVADSAPRFSGLAVGSADLAGVMEALAAHRGWLTTAPGLWLTLRSGGQDALWMGSEIEPANQVELEIYYGDRSGEPAGLALWQNETLVRQLDLPAEGGRWRLTVPAIPDSFLYAVATQEDGDFAVTAPLYVRSGDEGEVLLNEVLVSPDRDHNGDGTVNSDDEFIELFNPGKAPMALAGLQLGDDRSESSAGVRFTFGASRTLDGHGYLVLWRDETRLNLNNDRDRVVLFGADGVEIDSVGWDSYPGQDRSISRVPDGKGWVLDTDPTPGRTNVGDEVTPPTSVQPSKDEEDAKEEARACTDNWAGDGTAGFSGDGEVAWAGCVGGISRPGCGAARPVQ